MIKAERYSAEKKTEWDSFIKSSKADTFLFLRDFMDYHSDRFKDCSFLFFKKGKLKAVLPANIEGKILYSHQGLTYGGLVSSSEMTVVETLAAFDALTQEAKKMNVEHIIYKPIPHIYQKLPAQEDIYALYKFGAEKIGCNISSTICLKSKISFTESRKSGIKKAIKESVKVENSSDFESFWHLLNKNLLKKYGNKPAHTLNEILILKEKFPENIKLYLSRYKNQTVAGVLVFQMKNIIHVQYISANDVGKSIGALDLLFNFLINKEFQNYKYFDLGSSNEQLGNVLNENLIFQKEGFGGRGVVYETYKLHL